MSTKFVATGTQIVASMALGVGAKRACVRAGWYTDAGVTGAAVTLQGSMDNITFVLLISWANGLKGSGTWCHPGQARIQVRRPGRCGICGHRERDRRDRHLRWRLSRFRARRRGNVVMCAKAGAGRPWCPAAPVSAAGCPAARDQAAVRMPLLAPMAAPPPEFSFHRPKPQVRDLSGAAGLIHLLAHQLQQLGLRRRHPGKVPVPIRPPARLPGR